MTIIIDNIITPYEIVRYNGINKVLNGKLEVWFQQKSAGQYLPKINFRYKSLRNKFEIIGLLSQYKTHLTRVICCGWDSFAYLYAFWFCKRNKIRFTLWSGSTIYEESYRRRIFIPLVKLIISKTDDFIAYGTRAKEYLISLGAAKDSIRIFLNSIDVDYFKYQAKELKELRLILRNRYQIPVNDTVFVFIGQLIERKGIRELLSAFATVTAYNNKISLLIVGKGKLRSEVESFTASHPEVNIKLLGYIEYNKIPEIYAISNVLILPSKQEVWGLVVNEALASGIPVLMSRFAGCVSDLVDKDNGEIIEEVSPKGIETVLNKFLRKKKYMISPETLGKMRNEIYAEEVFTN